MNVLIIDDEQLIRQSVYDQLKRMDLPIEKILAVSGAKEAREVLQHTEI